MAQWIFRQVSDGDLRDRALRWTWQLERNHEVIIERSTGSFLSLTLCMDDAAKHGYYGGHYAVDIRPVHERSALRQRSS